jgi:hypothetical protein
MVSFSKSLVVGLALALCETLGASGPALSADLGAPYTEPATNKWQFSLTPYGWATSMNGDITARGHTVDVNEDFIDIVEKSDSLLAWMTYFEARMARFSFFTDFVWADIGFPGHGTSKVTPSSTTKKPSSSRASPMRSLAGRAHREDSPPWISWAAHGTGTKTSIYPYV